MPGTALQTVNGLPRTAPKASAGVLMALACALLWGSQFAIAKNAYATLDALQVNTARYAIAAVLLLACLAWREGLSACRFDGRLAAALSAGIPGLCLSPTLVYSGLMASRPETVAVIVATQPAMTALALWFVHRRRPPAFTLAMIGLAFVGVVSVVTRWQWSLAGGETTIGGALLVLAGSVCWVFYTLRLDAFPGWSTLRLSALIAAPATLALLAIMLLAQAFGWSTVPSAADWRAAAPSIAWLGLASVFAATLMWTAAVRTIGSLNGMLILNLVPVTAYAIGIASGRHPERSEALGAAVVVIALVANNLYLRRRRGSR